MRSWTSVFLMLLRFWNTDRSLTALLVALCLFLFVVTPLASSAVFGSELSVAFFTLLTVTGVAAVARKPTLVALVASLALGSVALDWIAHFGATLHVQIENLVLRVIFVLLLGTLVTSQVFRPGNVTHHRVQGAIVVYLLAAMAWSHLYQIVSLLDSSAFWLSPAARAGSPLGLFRYYSFETLTTLGAGEVLPVSPMARALASSEALFGQLYPAAMIARLISLELGKGAVGRSGD